MALGSGRLTSCQAYCSDSVALDAAGVVSGSCQPDGDALGATRRLAGSDAALCRHGGERQRESRCVSSFRCNWHLCKIPSCGSHCPEPAQVLSLVGGTVNVLRWPERQFQPAPGRPGRFDYWLNSHQVSILTWLPRWCFTQHRSQVQIVSWRAPTLVLAADARPGGPCHGTSLQRCHIGLEGLQQRSPLPDLSWVQAVRVAHAWSIRHLDLQGRLPSRHGEFSIRVAIPSMRCFTNPLQPAEPCVTCLASIALCQQHLVVSRFRIGLQQSASNEACSL